MKAPAKRRIVPPASHLHQFAPVTRWPEPLNDAGAGPSRSNHPVVGRFIVAAMSPSPLSFGIQVGGEDTAATERPNWTSTNHPYCSAPRGGVNLRRDSYESSRRSAQRIM